MLNQFVLVGRLKEIVNGREIIISVSSLEKNDKGEYVVEEILVDMSLTLMENLERYCKPGDVIGIKGFIKHPNKLFAEKITCLSRRTGE